jgi:hypothetical protein
MSTLPDLEVADLRPPPRCVPFESRATHAPWFDRVDPFWLGYGANPHYSWYSAYRYEPHWVLTPRGPQLVRRRTNDFESTSQKRFHVPGGRVERIAAVLAAWRVLTTQQICAMVSMDDSRVSRTLRAMMSAGLVERTQMTARFEISTNTPFLWRPRVTSVEWRQWLGSLDTRQHTAITMGVEGGASGHDRHDVLAAEVALRWAEITPSIQAILGERAASAEQLLGDHPDVRSRGDAVLVRDDGLRIVLEITTQPALGAVRTKMARWGRLLGERGGHHRTGIVVVFLAAAAHDHTGKQGASLTVIRRSLERAMTVEAVGDGRPVSPATVNQARRSVMVAHWQDWFPAPWYVSQRFADLAADVSLGDGRFVSVALGRPDVGVAGGIPGAPFAPPGGNWQSIRRARRHVPAVPRWLEQPVLHRISPQESAP